MKYDPQSQPNHRQRFAIAVFLALAAVAPMATAPTRAASPPDISQFAYEHFAGCFADFEGFTVFYEQRRADIEGGAPAPEGELARLSKLLETRNAGVDFLGRYSILVRGAPFNSMLDHRAAEAVYDETWTGWRRVIETTPTEREDWLRDNEQSMTATFEESCRHAVIEFSNAVETHLPSSKPDTR